MRIVAAELFKIWATRTYRWLCLAYALIAGFVAWAITQEGAASIERAITAGNPGFAFLVALGALCFAGEPRGGLSHALVQVTPRRQQLLAAKLSAAGIAAVIYAGIGIVTALVVSGSATTLKRSTSVFGGDGVLVAVVGVIAMSIIWSAIGVALNALVRNVAITTISVVVWVLALEGLVRAVASSVEPVLLTEAASALQGSTSRPMWSGAVVVVAWISVLIALGSSRLASQDVTQ